MSEQESDDVNPMASPDKNDLFVFAPSVATMAILLCMLYGFGQITIRLVDSFVTPLSGTVSLIGTIVVTLVYITIIVGLVYQDNGIELPVLPF